MNEMKQQIGYTEWRVHSLLETMALARTIANLSAPSTVITLDGDLGAGKTAFSQAFAAAIGVRDTVSSPTFTIIKEYKGDTLPLYHMDVYRLSMEEAEELGLDDYFYGSGVTVVEWASLIEGLLPAGRLELYFENLGGESRAIRARGVGLPYARWCEEWNKMGATEE